MNNYTCGLLLTSLSITSVTAQSYEPHIIPKPVNLSLLNGQKALGKTITVKTPTGIKDKSDLIFILNRLLGDKHNIIETKQLADITLGIDAKLSEEEYRVSVSSKGITITARSSAGLRYGLQTLGQLYDGKGHVRLAQISDKPSYEYRGLMLDVSRHFVPVAYIKTLLDEMARLKLNRFHWHLVDGGGWRMESKRYPKLTQLAAFRTESDWTKWWNGRDRRFVPEGTANAYGGYYTQAEIKELVAYAGKLGITIIPEIELPGHSNELFFAHPELFCPGTEYQEASDVCIGNDETFTFFEQILDEALNLFPSKDIHIGGDEAVMEQWKKCPRCQARMKQEGIKDVHGLQSYMIHRMEKYLNSKGRNMIGWDEILMGGLAPNATVMSWRGEEGGITAAKAGHKVIMTPNSHLYLDFYQGNAKLEPRAIGGYTPLEKVYSYTPPTTSDMKGRIIGIQANLWTEYVESTEHVSYMLFPRALALAEITWTPKALRSYPDFRERITRYLPQLQARGQHPYKLIGINAEQGTNNYGATQLKLTAERSDAVIRFEPDGTPVTKHSPIFGNDYTLSSNNRSRYISANVFLGDEKQNKEDLLFRIGKHLGMNAKIQYNCQWNSKYPANKEQSLIDGIDGSLTYLDGKWQGFTEPMDVTIELPKKQSIREVAMRFLAEREQWVYMPSDVEVLVSEDGKQYTSIGVLKPKTDENNPRPVVELFKFNTDQVAKYIRIKANIGRSPGHFIFCDEVIIL